MSDYTQHSLLTDGLCIPFPPTNMAGSGKTTLLKHILMNKQGINVGIAVNDFAEVSTSHY